MKNVHRPSNSAMSFGLGFGEVRADGTESVVPTELICRAKVTVLKDSNIHWVSVQETKRFDAVLTAAFEQRMEDWFSGERETAVNVSEAIQIADEGGYRKVSTILTEPDENVIEHHVLCCSESGEYVDVVLVHWDEGEGSYLHHIDARNTDYQHDNMILRLSDEQDVVLARQHGLLCEDDEGYHVQVCVYRSVYWQCNRSEPLSEDLLREFWRRTVSQA